MARIYINWVTKRLRISDPHTDVEYTIHNREDMHLKGIHERMTEEGFRPLEVPEKVAYVYSRLGSRHLTLYEHGELVEDSTIRHLAIIDTLKDLEKNGYAVRFEEPPEQEPEKS